MFALCSSFRRFTFSRCTAWSRKKYSPVHELSSIPMMLSNVDLPAPDGPMIVTNSPGIMSSVTRRSKKNLFGPASIDFSKFRIEIKGSTPSPSNRIHSITQSYSQSLKIALKPPLQGEPLAIVLVTANVRALPTAPQVRKIKRVTEPSGVLCPLSLPPTPLDSHSCTKRPCNPHRITLLRKNRWGWGRVQSPTTSHLNRDATRAADPNSPPAGPASSTRTPPPPQKSAAVPETRTDPTPSR